MGGQMDLTINLGSKPWFKNRIGLAGLTGSTMNRMTVGPILMKTGDRAG
jgi:hypothetical protein